MPIAIAPVERKALQVLARSRLSVTTTGPGFIDLTGALTEFLRGVGGADGLLALFVRHTSASLTVQENADPDVRADLLDALARLAPENAGYRHHLEGPDDMPAHIKTMLSDISMSIPVAGGRMGLGTWQAVYLVEHRARPHRRQVDLTFVGA
jgi:secondary thiamine-phosphate synthase enzyme